MPPLPKDPSVRRRRNKTPGARVLTFPTKTSAPPLPDVVEWHPRVLAWWSKVWASPMAAEWLDADVERLYMLAVVVDRFWRSGDPALLSEIRLTGALFGLSPIDRRRLSWEIDRGEEADERAAKRRSAAKPATARPAKPKTRDPRLALAQ